MLDESDTIGHRREHGQEVAGLEQLEGMRIEGDNNGRPAKCFRLAAQFVNQGPVPGMHTVEITDAHRSGPKVLRRHCGPWHGNDHGKNCLLHELTYVCSW